MKPIISPWLIYFAELADSINMAFLFVTFIAFIIMAFAFIPYMDNKKDETLKQCLKKSFIWFCISVAIVVMTPSKDTVYTMVVLDNVTTDNIQAIGKTGTINIITSLNTCNCFISFHQCNFFESSCLF